MSSDLWLQVERLLPHVERPTRYIDHEWGACRRDDAAYRVALMYPDAYEVGMANQALEVLAARLQELEDVATERVFLPWVDMSAAMREAAIPLFTLESYTPVCEVDLFGITLSNELTYSNVLEALDLAGIPLRAVDRDDSHPLVIGGGPSAHNPEPMAPFFDAILIGDGEDAVQEIVASHRASIASGVTREESVHALATIEGVYVPSLYTPGSDGRCMASQPAPDRVRRRILADLDAYPAPVCPVVPYADVVHDRATVEVLRGCSRGCRFCQAGMVYRPVRERSADSIVRDAIAGLACTGYEELSLTSLSTADHSQLEPILRRLVARLEGTGTAISVPSLRMDSFTVPLARLLGNGRKSGLTFAPEAGSQRLRDAINKNITEEEVVTAVHEAFTAGWRRVKLYFMIGLPTETDEDVRAIGALVEKVLHVAREATPKGERGGLRVAVSVATFVPKAHTPFQWDGQTPIDEVRRRQRILRDSVPHRGVELSWHDPSSSLLEAALARGGREMADGIEAAWRVGARFDAWTEQFSLTRWLEAFASVGLDMTAAASTAYVQGEPLPWSHIDSGLAEKFLRLERARADSAITTPDCTFEECTGCGVCTDLGVDISIAEGGRRG
ncbi:MAG: TIGR03960 family B12-binding radical SAM protein [Coriobacteriia bacterium]|nr:TIGR03960 family B12-binding radical SAM protein [Coriobacteriia bacterium]